MNLKRFWMLLVCLFILFTTKAQTLINNEVLLFSIENKTIDFIVADKNLEEKKPVLLFCQGSLPIPLLIKKEDGTTEIIAGGQARLDAQSKKISWTEASTAIDESILFYQHASDPKNQTEDPSLIAWKSFSQPSLNDWLKIEIPIYIVYGTEDTSSAFCDIVPLFFISQQKQNLTVKRYIGVEHNFFKVENGKVDYENDPEWKKVMTEFLNWIEK